jgi:hypothetical protein
MPSNQLGTDLTLLLKVDTPHVLDNLFVETSAKAWFCVAIIACKTTLREDRSVDGRQVKQAQKTTSSQFMYTTKDKEERPEHNVRKQDALEMLYKCSQTMNILFVRYLVCFPGASNKSHGKYTPPPTDVWKRKVTITFQDTQNTKKSFSFYELVVTVDRVSAKKLLGIDDTIVAGVAKIWSAALACMDVKHVYLLYWFI